MTKKCSSSMAHNDSSKLEFITKNITKQKKTLIECDVECHERSHVRSPNDSPSNNVTTESYLVWNTKRECH